jgi:hypothetical protein
MSNTNTATKSGTITSKVLSERAVLLHLSIGGWNAKISDDDARDTVVRAFGVENADRIDAKKCLIDPEILKKVKNAGQQARVWHYKHSVPWMDGGLRLISAIKLDEHCAKLRELRSGWEKEVIDLRGKIGPALEEGKKALSGLGKDEDFPSEDVVLSKFKFSYGLVPVPDQRDIRVELSAEGMAEAQASVNRLVDESSKGILVDIQNRVSGVVQKIVETLADKKERTKKSKKDGTVTKDVGYSVFRDSLIENALEIVPLIRELNILEDPSVEALATNLENTLKGVNPEKIRGNEDYRKEVIDKTKGLLDNLKLGGFGEGADEPEEAVAA